MFINPNLIVRSRAQAGTISLAVYRRPFVYAPGFMSELVLSRSIALGERADIVIEQNAAKTSSALRLKHRESLVSTDVLDEQDVTELGMQSPDLRSLRRTLARQMTGSRSWMRWLVRAFALLGLFYVVTTMIMGPRLKTQWIEPQAAVQASQAPVAVSGTLTPPAQPAPESPEGRALSSVALASDALALPRVTLEAALAKSSGIRVRVAADKAPTVIVWSDPLCPHCRDLEAKLEALPASVGITIVPVSFRPGAKVVVANIACGATNEEQAARWTSWMAAQPKGDFTQSCDRGPLVADQNSVMMVRAGVVATPTLAVARGDKLVAFDGNVDNLTTETLMNWVTKS